jgi:hypothetical protein
VLKPFEEEQEPQPVTEMTRGGGGAAAAATVAVSERQHTEPLRLFTPVVAFIQQPLFDSPKPLQPTHASHDAAHAS